MAKPHVVSLVITIPFHSYSQVGIPPNIYRNPLLSHFSGKTFGLRNYHWPQWEVRLKRWISSESRLYWDFSPDHNFSKFGNFSLNKTQNIKCQKSRSQIGKSFLASWFLSKPVFPPLRTQGFQNGAGSLPRMFGWKRTPEKDTIYTYLEFFVFNFMRKHKATESQL